MSNFLSVKIEGLDALKRAVGETAARQVPFAAAKAISKTALSVERRFQSDMAGTFKSASKFVTSTTPAGKPTFVVSAKKTDLTATVGLKDMKRAGGTAPAVLLKEHFGGGARGRKPFEKAIHAMGVMPQGWRAMPGAGMRLDAYGNPNRKDIGEMFNVLRASVQVWKGSGKKVALTGYFVVPVGARSHLAPGIYKRIGRDVIKPMFVFVKQADYRKVLDMKRSADEVVAREFQPNFDAAFTEAMRTAR